MVTEKINILLILMLFLCNSCSHRYKEKKFNTDNNRYSICFDDKQEILKEITTTTLTKQLFQDYIECSGTIKPSLKNQFVVSAPVQGFVKDLFTYTGEYVEKGKTLALIENSEYISIQENYLVTKSQYEYFKEDFKRQGELSLENATSLKVMQSAQNEFRKTEAKLYSLKKTLDIIGINCDSVRPDHLRSTIEIKAPISGKVNMLNTKLGIFCSSENPICEITGTTGQVIYLKLNKSQVININTNRPMEFSISTKPEKFFKTKIFSLFPMKDDPDNFEIYADIQNDSECFNTGIPVNVKISAIIDSAYVLPNEAIISVNNKSYGILKTENNCFSLEELNTGKSIDKKTRIISMPDNIRNTVFVVNGSQMLYQKIKISNKEIR